MGDAADAAKKVATAPVKAISKIPGGFINKVIVLLFIALVVLGGFMYFGVTAGTKNFEFIDLELKVDSMALQGPSPSPHMQFFTHSITSLDGFNSITVVGKVKTNTDITASDIYVAAKIYMAGYCDCDPTGCNRVWHKGPTFYYPQVGWLLIKNLGGMQKGDVETFQFTITKDQLLKTLRLQSYYKDVPNDIDGFSGDVYVAIIAAGVHRRTFRTTSYGYQILETEPPRVYAKVKALEWNFNVKTDALQSIVAGDEGFSLTSESVYLPQQSAQLSLKVTNSGAVLLTIIVLLFASLLALGFVKWSDVSLWMKLLLFALIVALILFIPRFLGLGG